MPGAKVHVLLTRMILLIGAAPGQSHTSIRVHAHAPTPAGPQLHGFGPPGIPPGPPGIIGVGGPNGGIVGGGPGTQTGASAAKQPDSLAMRWANGLAAASGCCANNPLASSGVPRFTGVATAPVVASINTAHSVRPTQMVGSCPYTPKSASTRVTVASQMPAWLSNAEIPAATAFAFVSCPPTIACASVTPAAFVAMPGA